MLRAYASERPVGRPCPKCLFGLALESLGPVGEQIGSYRILSRLGRGGTYNSGSSRQVQSRDAEIAASASACP